MSILIAHMCIYVKVSALDVSFIPNDENAPLPLSAKYRESLRKLCGVLKSGSKLPPELILKKKSLKSLCQKLDKDDRNIASAIPFDFTLFFRENFNKIIFSVLGLGGGYLMWTNRHSAIDYFRSLKPKKRYSVSTVEVDDNQRRIEIELAREARLKRFASINSNTADIVE